MGNSLALVTGLYWLLHAPHLNQPAALAGLSCNRYSLMQLGDFARRGSPCSHRSPMD